MAIESIANFAYAYTAYVCSKQQIFDEEMRSKVVDEVFD